MVPIPDERRANIVTAFVTLAPGTAGTGSLKDDIVGAVRETLPRHGYPRDIGFRDELPKTVPGKSKRTDLTDEVG